MRPIKLSIFLLFFIIFLCIVFGKIINNIDIIIENMISANTTYNADPSVPVGSSNLPPQLQSQSTQNYDNRQ